MLVYAPDKSYAEKVLRTSLVPAGPAAGASALAAHAPGCAVWRGDPGWSAPFGHCCLVEHADTSQYDLFVRLLGDLAELPDRALALAGTGSGFHGLRNRPWVAQTGNLHLTVLYRPDRAVPGFGAGFLALPAVAVAECADAIGGLAGRARIKWTNDVLIDGAKIAGVLTHLQTVGDRVTGVVLGIGLNVETRPEVTPDPFVPRAACLAELASAPVGLPAVLAALVDRLDRRYEQLREGGWRELVRRYRERSAVIGRRVRVVADGGPDAGKTLAAGVVETIDDELGLRLRGRTEPLRQGQLILEP